MITEKEDIGDSRSSKARNHLTMVSEQPPILVELANNPCLKRVVLEYHKLANKPNLADEYDLNRLVEIYEMAQNEELLEIWIDKVDSGNDLDVLALLQSEKTLSLEEFLIEVENLPHQVTAEEFRELAERLYRSNSLDSMIEKRISFAHNERLRYQPIWNNNLVHIFVKSWLPGQEAPRHEHGDNLNVIYVYQGEMISCPILRLCRLYLYIAFIFLFER